jgi:malate dehydrogenase
MKLTVLGGGGWVGSAAAFHIATLRLVDEIVLVGGRRTSMTAQHAFDLDTAVAALGVGVSAGGYDDLTRSDVVINAAGVPHTGDRDRMLAGNIVLMGEIAGHVRAHCPDAVIITATNPVDPLNYATWRAGGFARRQVIGYSLNDSFRFRGFIAAAKGVPVGEVQATVIGEHGPAQVLLFSSVRIAGEPASFTEEEKRRIRDARPEVFKRVEVLQRETGRTMGWTCAIGLAQLVAAIAGDSGEIFPCSAVLDGEYGARDLSMGVPARIGRTGIQEIVESDLAEDERAALADCAAQMKVAAEEVDAALAGAAG